MLVVSVSEKLQGKVNFYNIFSANLLQDMAAKLPKDQAQLARVEGMTGHKIKQFRAERFLDITASYALLVESKLPNLLYSLHC